MAGQLTIDTLKAGSGVLATQNGMTGIAKAWVTFNGGRDSAGDYATPGAINASFNVSSITVNGTGDFTINFTTALPSSNYAIAGSAASANSSINGPGRYMAGPAGTQSTTQCRITTQYQYNALQDVWQVGFVAFAQG
jgi:hypothetical protein